jgi:hypothetical protein
LPVFIYFGQSNPKVELIPLEVSSGEVYLVFIDDAEKAQEIAIRDIAENKIKRPLSVGIAPVMIHSDEDFEKNTACQFMILVVVRQSIK